MTILVTGAAGFIGSAVVRQLAARPDLGKVRLFDRDAAAAPSDPRFTSIAGDLLDTDTRLAALSDVESVIHLISLPGGSAEANPVLSREINIDLTLALAEGLARNRSSRKARMVFASTIAVLGTFNGPVDDSTAPAPELTYGAHKWMAEIGLADFDRRGAIETISLRLPGIVARPPGAEGLKSAFMSDVFHAAAADEEFIWPVSRDASFWMMSANRAAANLVHALDVADPGGRAITLPAVQTTAAEMTAALFRDGSKVGYAPVPDLEAVFGRYPPLTTLTAEALGFSHDGDLSALIASAR